MIRFPGRAALALAASALAMSTTACNPPVDKAKPESKMEKAAKSDEVTQIAGLPTERDQISYMVGLEMAKTLEQVKEDVDADVISKAIKSSLAGEKPLMDEEQAQQIAKAFGQKMQAKQIEKKKAAAKKNMEEGERFLAENGKKPEVKTTASGLQYQVISEGKGPKPADSDVIRAHYKGISLDGKTFDSSYDRGEPVTFPMTGVIPGWREGIALMPVGSKFKLWIPAAMAYGESGSPGGSIGPNAMLAFEVELLEIVKQEAK